MSPIEMITEQLPESTTAETIGIVGSESEAANLLFRFPPAINKKAVLIDEQSQINTDYRFQILTVSSECLEDEQILDRVKNWVEPQAAGFQPALVLSLQHVQIFWTPERIALFLNDECAEDIKSAVVEVSYYVAQLVTIETKLATNWPDLEGDIPIAFQYDQQASQQQKKLRKRFQETYTLRAQLAKLTPFLLSPHTYPPTLASQISDRLRERIRVEDRVEFVSDSLEVFEEVYELCGQRASDFHHARKGHTLEWIIIILLAAELLIVSFDYLSSLGS